MRTSLFAALIATSLVPGLSWAQSQAPAQAPPGARPAPESSAPSAQRPAAEKPGAGTTSQEAQKPPSSSERGEPGSSAAPDKQKQPAQSAAGIRAVDPRTLVLTFYQVRPADFLAENLIGADVYNIENEEIGEIEDLIIDDGKRISGIVLSIGGFLGIGERYIAVQPQSIAVTRQEGGDLRAIVNTRREELEKAPEFKFEGGLRRK